MGRRRKVARRSLVPVEIQASKSYIDSVFLILPELMEKPVFREFRLSLAMAQSGSGERYVLKRLVRRNQTFFFVLAVHQPTLRTLEILSGAIAPHGIQARIHEVHVALDLMVKTRFEAADLQKYVEERLWTSNRVAKPVVRVGETTYFNRRNRKGVEVALYSDRISKAAQGACLHIEWRSIGARILRDTGLNNALFLANLDHKKFWRERLVLFKAPSADILAKARMKVLRKLSSKPLRENQLLRDASTLLRLSGSRDGGAVSNDLLVHLSKYRHYHQRPTRLFAREPTDWMLPDPDNAMWSRPMKAEL